MLAAMRSYLIELARLGGRIAMEHFRASGITRYSTKGRSDYVSHVDRRVEDAIVSRIRAHHPDHLVIAEESLPERPDSITGPCWIIDPIDGTTNFLRGLPGWSISICFCDHNAEPRHAIVYDPVADERFIGERDAGTWVNEQRVYTSGCATLDEALVATALPFRHREPLADGLTTLAKVVGTCDDIRRIGSCALEMAYVACGRLDAYFELGIQPWDFAAGDLLVRSAGGASTDYRGDTGNLLTRRSQVAAASPALLASIVERLDAMQPWLSRPPYAANPC